MSASTTSYGICFVTTPSLIGRTPLYKRSTEARNALLGAAALVGSETVSKRTALPLTCTPLTLRPDFTATPAYSSAFSNRARTDAPASKFSLFNARPPSESVTWDAPARLLLSAANDLARTKPPLTASTWSAVKKRGAKPSTSTLPVSGATSTVSKRKYSRPSTVSSFSDVIS